MKKESHPEEKIKEISEEEFKIALKLFGIKPKVEAPIKKIDAIEKNAFDKLYESIEKENNLVG